MTAHDRIQAAAPGPAASGDAPGPVQPTTSGDPDQSAQRLADSNAWFRALADNIPQLAWMARPDGWIVWYNRRWFDYTGTTLEQMQGWGWRAVHHPDHVARVVKRLQHSWDTGEPWEDTFPLRSRGGTYRWFLSRAEPIRDARGRIALWFGTNTDVTEQRAAEAAAAEGQTRLRLALAAGRMGLFSWDVAADRLEWDARQFALFGLDPAQGPPTGAQLLARIHPKDRHRLKAAIAAVLKPGAGVFEDEFRVIPPNGVVRWVGVYCGVRRGPDGRAVSLVGLNFDLTERKEAEAVLARDKAELERLVLERTRDLQEAQGQLAHAQRMEALGQLAGGIAHDFNNVLQAIQGGAGLIERRAGDPDGVRRLTQMILEATSRGSAITRRLLAFSRRGELRAESVDPADLLAGLREIFVHTLGGGIEVRTELQPGLSTLRADKGQLETVLVNLAANARDAMPDGGVLTLTAAPEGVRADGDAPSTPKTGAPLLEAGRYIRLSVGDTGSGMTQDVLARAAEPFFTTKPSGRGTGLGLAMARGFAEQSGGSLQIDSVAGQGTVVSLWLPVTAARDLPVTHRPEPQEPPIGTGRARVLLVDDDATVREVTAEQLENAGYAVVTADSGPAALELLDAGEAVNLVISDLSMAGMDGVAVIREAQRRRPGLPAMLLTGFVTTAAELAVGGALRGTFSLLRKPATAQQLAERAAVLLEGATTD